MATRVTVVEWLRRRQLLMSVAVLAVLAYAPSISAAPGRMPTDSKLYVYLDPSRFLADATTTMDPRQFGGWVPHQHIAYLWPTGPWFWFFETLGVPDWIAHRLWIGTLLVVAGLGVRWLARVLGFGPVAALVAAVVYQLSPYILPYVSRTSVLLLPFAGLGWIVGLTIRAGQDGRWRYPGAIALVVFTVGAVNATALAMVVPAPVIWLVHAAWQGSITWRRAVGVAVRTGALCVGVSLWWIMMLLIQSGYGADVLAYSESLESVSFTSTSTEVSRGLGYWLFYIRDASSAATTASLDHLVSGRTVFLGALVTIAGLVGIAFAPTPHRRFAALLFGAGVILGVGVHPIDDPSPVMAFLLGDGEGGLALALRSSTRAIPVMLLGLAIGSASLVSLVAGVAAWERWQVPRTLVRVAVAGLLIVLAIGGLPALRNGGFIDPALERDQDPPAHWREAAADLDARPEGYRVIQLPGAEFGSFQWGHTVDQPLPGLTERPLLTRDLLPLGSAAPMDLLFALDDRVQSDTIEPHSVAAVARLLGADTLWIAGDVAYDRYRLARPEVVTDELTSPEALAAGLGGSSTFGAPTVMTAVVPVIDDQTLSDPRIGQPIAPVTLVDVANAVPTVRVKDSVVILSGSGDGVVDAAAAGILDGTEAVLYSASLPDSDSGSSDGAFRFVLSDSNRDRAHHWRSSQDVTGFTESAADDSDVLRFEGADQRLPVFDAADSATQTVSIQDGPVTARASSYGEPFAYLPEHRPVMAVDGDETTAWLTADRAPAVGEFIELTFDASVDHLVFLQPPVEPAHRTISQVRIDIAGRAPIEVTLDESSRVSPGQRVELVPTDGPSVATITIVSTTSPQPPIGEAIGAVGFVEIDAGLGPTVEWIRTPVDGLDEMAAAGNVDIVLTRLRTEPTDRWRNDPEVLLAREFETSVALEAEMDITVRLDQRLDGVALAELLGESAVATDHLAGAPNARGAAAFDGESATAWTTPFDRVIGQAVSFTGGTGSASRITIDQPVDGQRSPITRVRITDSGGPVDVDLVLEPGAAIELPRPIELSSVRLEILAIDQKLTRERRFNEMAVLPAAISEIRFDGSSPEVRPKDTLGVECGDELLTLDGVAVPVRFEVSSSDALLGRPIAATVCEPLTTLDAGVHRLRSAPSAFDVDRVVFRSGGESGLAQIDPTQPVLVDSSARHAVVEVPACPNGCWVIHGTGYNKGWEARTGDGASLGAPRLLDGNANGWWIEPTDVPTRVEIDWPVQRRLNFAFAATALSIVGCLTLFLLGWRRQRVAAFGIDELEPSPVGDVKWPDERPERDVVSSAGTSLPPWRAGIFGLVTALGAALFIDWIWAVPVVVVWGVAMLMRQPRIVGAVGLVIVGGSQLVVANVVRTERPFPDAGWPARFEWLHPWTLLGVVLLTGSGLVAFGGRRHTPDAS